MKIKGKSIVYTGSVNIGNVLRGEEDSCRALSTLNYYTSAYELLDNETILPEIDADFLGYLRTFDAFDSIVYFCLDSETVIYADRINGDVYGIDSIDDMLQNIKNYYEWEAFCKT